jgi:hypothetical protein
VLVPRRALCWPAEAELGYAPVAVGRARGPRQRREHGPRQRHEHGPHPRGHGPWAAHALCIWAERGFGPVTLELVFLFSEYIQILANLKICVGFI